MPLRPFVRRASTTTDGELIIQKPPPVLRRHSSVQAASPQLPPIPRVSPLLDPNEQDRLVHSDDSTAASSRYSGGSSLLDGGRKYGSADEGTVLTTASSVEDETGKLSPPPPPLFTQRFAPTALAKDAGPNNLREAWFVSAPLAPVPVEDVLLADEDDNDADYDDDDDGVVYIDNESSDEEEDEEEPSAADHDDDDLVLSCGCDGGAPSRLPPPVSLPEGQLPWTFPRRDSSGSGTLREAPADPDDDDPALIEAERILLTTPEPTDGVFSSPRSSLNISPRSVVSAGPTKRPSLPLPELPFPPIKKSGSAVPPSAPRPEHAFERRLERLVFNCSESDDEDAGEETEVEAGRRRPTAAAPRVALATPAAVLPARPPRRRPNKLHKRRRSSSAGGISGGEGRPKKPPFDRFSYPTEQGMASALECEIATETGEAIKFGDMLRERKHDKVVVIFLRHAWCGLCQQYVEALNRASLNLVSITGNMFADLGGGPATTSRIVPLDVVLINSSTPTLIGPYRQRHHTPFPLFSDRRRKLYKALGMTRKTWDMGKDADKGSYIVKSQMQNVTSSISAGVKMPKYPGSQTQLGGEFVFEHDRETDSFKCLFVSRMHNTRAHAEIRDVFAAAGVELDEQDAASVYGS
ncbi:hypothetical protein JCM8115_001992 [Rhodotorula mucilaginosa]|nr:hypothetical protein B0A53_05456 [Rhodotorula sp. CCFEE 5036]